MGINGVIVVKFLHVFRILELYLGLGYFVS